MSKNNKILNENQLSFQNTTNNNNTISTNINQETPENSKLIENFTDDVRKKVLCQNFSVYKHVKSDYKLGTTHLFELLESIKTGVFKILKSHEIIREPLTRDIQEIRLLAKALDANYSDDTKQLKQLLKTYKEKLYPFTLSRLSKSRDKNIVEAEYTGLIQVDIDYMPNPSTVDRLKIDPFFICLFKSPSGTGIKGIIYNHKGLSKHKEVFNEFAYYMFKEYNIDVDPSVKDTNRPFYFSYDPDITVNNSFIPFELPNEYVQEYKNDNEYKVLISEKASKEGLSIFYEMLKYLVVDDYKKYFRIAVVAKQVFNLAYNDIDPYINNHKGYNYNNNLAMYNGLEDYYEKPFNLLTIAKLLINQDKGLYFKHIKYLIDELFDSNKINIDWSKIANTGITKSDNTILQELKTGKTKFIIAPTGGGKTYSMAIYFIECIKAGKTPVYICPTKKAQEQFKKYIAKMLNIKNTTQLYRRGIYTLNNNTAKQFFKKSFNGAILLNVYFHRKGDSINLFEFIKELNNINNIALLFDEADQLIMDYNKTIYLASRYYLKVTKNSTANHYFKCPKCPVFGRFGNCNNCIEHNNNVYNNNKNKNILFKYCTMKDFKDKDRYNIEPDVDLNRILELFDIANNDNYYDLSEHNMRLYPQSPDKYKNVIEDYFNYSERVEFVDVLKHFIKHSVNANIVYYYPTDKEGKEISIDKLKNAYNKVQASTEINNNVISIDNNNEQKKLNKELIENTKFPSMPCHIPILTFFDAFVLNYIKDLNIEIKFVSGTLSNSNQSYLKHIFPDIEINKIANSTTSEIKIDSLLCLGLNQNMSLNDDSKFKLNLKKLNSHLLLFKQSKSQAWKTYKKIEGCSSINTAINDRNDFYDTTSNNRKRKKDVLITYPNSPIGRGANINDYDICIVDTSNYKPQLCYIKENSTKEDIYNAIIADSIDKVIQNTGRILRKNKASTHNRKITIFENIKSIEHLNTIIEISGWQDVIINPIQYDYLINNEYNDITKTIENIGVSWFETGKYNKPVKSVDFKVAEKDNKKYNKLVKYIKKLYNQNYTKKQIKSRLNYYKKSSIEKNKIDSIISGLVTE